MRISNLVKSEEESEDRPRSNSDESDFLNACKLITAQREKYGYSINALSKKTRISIYVLNSLEKGRKNGFPEKTFLRKMLQEIETELFLPKLSLNPILKNSESPKRIIKSIEFNPLNISLLSSWKGSLAYLLLIFIAIFSLNKQQQFLLKINSKTIEPLDSSSLSNDANIKILEENDLNNN
ncbi:helix-turn-helix domain-containing protein [Prochlorococcus sp. MIT 1223]|uniref:helix-turn-helix domain-containing protein n=1 Tax=Prochlorococcus sp. MIT 1223 TaxID=3096217 RepID=UPI002A748E06|nr:helix-turn-helix domain-containing protein [Prochlorococcus sp. MIT 1223]